MGTSTMILTVVTVLLVFCFILSLVFKFNKEGRFKDMDDKKRIVYMGYLLVLIAAVTMLFDFPSITSSGHEFTLWFGLATAIALLGALIMIITSIYGLTRKEHTVSNAIVKYICFILFGIADIAVYLYILLKGLS